jgi:hypothetical protein
MLQVIVFMLDLCNFVDMLYADSSCDLVARSASPFFYAGSFFEEIRSWGRFGDEGERAVRLDGDKRGSGYPWFYVCCASVELLAKIHRLDSTGSESRTDRWRRSGFACRNQNTLVERVK